MNAENHETPEEDAEEFVAELIDGNSGLPKEGDQPNHTEAEAEAEAEAETEDAAVVDAEISEPEEAASVAPAKPSVVYDPSVLVPTKPSIAKQPPSPFENLACKGGAVGAIVLGVLSFAGSFITSYAILNSFMGILLGLWGLRSNHQKMAMLGILLCLISAFFCVVEISAWIQAIWPQEDF